MYGDPEKIPDARRRIHLRYGDDLKLMLSFSFCPKILVIPMMLHPNISVVIRVERLGTAYPERMKDPSTFAPKVLAVMMFEPASRYC